MACLRLEGLRVKAVRFTEVVKAAGKPDVHLLLTEPALDPVLQKAVKAHRVMTVHQTAVGNKADHGIVGLVEGVKGQLLIFPKSLRAFESSQVVGIKYDLLKRDLPSGRSTLPKPRRPASKKSSPRKPPAAKIIPFPVSRPESEEDGTEATLESFKAVIRRALKALDAGKQVAAYRLLAPLVET
jgi:hypothetical protein